MLLAQVVETSGRIANTSKRLEKTGLLADLLRQLRPAEIEIAVAWLSGFTRQKKTGVGWARVQEARSSAASSPSLEILEVDALLEQVAGTQGSGSDRSRQTLLRNLFERATEPEQRFLGGLLTGELRQGALEGIMIDGLAKASGVSPDRVRRAVMMAGDIAAVAGALLREGETVLDRYDVQLFRPVQPMLAQTAEDAAGAVHELGEAALEWKLDGARIQVHKEGDRVAIYSRNLNEVTAAVPEIVESVRLLPAPNLILEGEVLSLRPDGTPHPFQTTMRRFGRRLDVDRLRQELPMTPFWFDLLYESGGSLLDETQATRFAALKSLVPPASVVPHTVTADGREADEFLRNALAQGHEGIMAKATNALYAAGARGQSWLKVKQARTLDLVILAAEWGNGRRKGWLSNLHLGARDTAKGGFAMLGKTFKGLTDEMLAWQTEQFLKLKIAEDSYTVYLEPRLVAEIAFNEIQISSRYVSGLALRFARVKRYRPDKSAEDADTFETVQRLAGISSTPEPL